MTEENSSAFIPPSIYHEPLLDGASWTHFSPVPPSLLSTDTETNTKAPCCLGVDEAGRGPVLGPMVYGVFYLPIDGSDTLLRETHHFDDSKVLTASFRTSLLRTLCTPSSDLHTQCGWATNSLSARSIAANMLKPNTYNLNAQAMDATIALIKGVIDRGVNIQEIYVDTIGQPATYQAKLQRIFPTQKITVAKKADSLYACVSAASVCAKVTRDVALETLYKARIKARGAVVQDGEVDEAMEWGSGYPSDARCVNWMKKNMHPVFGWGSECRFSWGTAKDMLDGKEGVKFDWPEEDDGSTMKVTDYFGASDDKTGELAGWYGSPTGLEAF
ncbi:Ribonuclease HII/HIII [Moelleriella libera RCEF 2490]|uniref:Ribonuclease n=1 Tax=Moelleriella libera RCEF 2490 TaxID=1081109 RepID=A0A168EEZ8_9HYPO|nr:Ribonuclease HII/HIII [Moelleriella libera RCEF 2490]